MPVPQLPALQVVRVRFTAVLEQALDWPAHGGALLRGVFGAALRKGVCSTGLPRCETCPLRTTCTYPAIFETPPRPTQFAQRFGQLPNPYVLEPPMGPMTLRAGAPLIFHMVLVGQGVIDRLRIIERAWQRAFDAGLGQRRVRGKLHAVEAVAADGCAVPLPDHRDARIGPPDVLPRLNLSMLMPAQRPVSDTLRLVLDSPLRLQRDGHPVHTSGLTPRAFLSSLLRRINLMFDLHLGIRPAPFDARVLLALAEEIKHDPRALHWVELNRYSARQERSLPQGGLLGHWLWRGEVGPLLPWLCLGQWLHVGKGATAGLGAYRVVLSKETLAR